MVSFIDRLIETNGKPMTARSEAYRGMTPEELERQYNPRLGRPDYEATVLPDWQSRSLQTRSSRDCDLGVPYGQGEKQRLDIFRCAAADAPTLIYIHGGYWQRGDRSLYSFVANPYVDAGFNTVIIGYDLCPNVRFDEIPEQIKGAIIHLGRHGRSHGLNPAKFALSGHSAGGHLTFMMMASAWPDDITPDIIKAGVALSPISELEPLLSTSINDAIGLTLDQAHALSPFPNLPPTTHAPQWVVCGTRESAEFQRQSDQYVAAYQTSERAIQRLAAKDCDHFDIVNAFSDPQNELFVQMMTMMRAI